MGTLGAHDQQGWWAPVRVQGSSSDLPEVFAPALPFALGCNVRHHAALAEGRRGQYRERRRRSLYPRVWMPRAATWRRSMSPRALPTRRCVRIWSVSRRLRTSTPITKLRFSTGKAASTLLGIVPKKGSDVSEGSAARLLASRIRPSTCVQVHVDFCQAKLCTCRLFPLPSFPDPVVGGSFSEQIDIRIPYKHNFTCTKKNNDIKRSALHYDYFGNCFSSLARIDIHLMLSLLTDAACRCSWKRHDLL